MTGAEQTARLAEWLASNWENLDQGRFFRGYLRRGRWEEKEKDLTLWHQIEYAKRHLSADDLRRQATDLRKATETT